MPATVYLETSVISYLTSPMSRDLQVAAHQQATTSWWDREHHFYEVVSSELVIKEAGAGDSGLAANRLAFLEKLQILTISDEAIELADRLIHGHAVPQKAAADALHIAICAVNGIDFLLTWNCKHINNPRTRHLIDNVCRENDFDPTVICTPEELLEEQPDVG